MTLASYRCLPEGGRSRPRPASPTLEALDAVAHLPAVGPLAAVDVYGRPTGRPPWLAGEYLALLERQGRGVGIIYLVHFDRPIGDPTNPRGFASHYTGWTLDLPARLVDHAQGRGARLMQVVGEQQIGWQLARIWTGPRARERSLKQRGASRRCPVCRLATLGLQPPRPVDPLALELGLRVATYAATVSPFELPPAVPHDPPTRPPKGGESRMPARRTWLTAAEVAQRLHVSPKTIARWAKQGRIEYRRTLGGHRRDDPQRIDQLVRALTYRP